MTMPNMKKLNLPITIFATGLLAGTLDILAAIFLLAGGNAVGTLKFIASGVFGQAALQSGNGMAALGLVFHYVIATSWTAAYFLLYPKLPFLRWNKWLNAIAYGLIAQTVMSRVVLPLSNVPPRPFTLSGFLQNAVILMFCIGLPVALSADRFYRARRN
jgi:hypothetical protein